MSTIVRYDFGKQMKALRADIGSVSFAESRYGRVTEFLDTGSFALNRICSGSVYNGIPVGRITLLNGESQTGKSFIAAQCMASALNAGYTRVFYFDSEGGALFAFMEKVGIDLSLVEHILVDSVEDAIIKTQKVFATIEEFISGKAAATKNNPKKDTDEEKAKKKEAQKAKETHEDARFMIVIDSVGALKSKKLQTDALAENSATDMGTTARKINELVTLMTIPALRSFTTVVLTNHIYEVPGEMHPSKIKESKGGKSLKYMPRLSIQITKSLQKDALDNIEDDDAFYQGSKLNFFTIKSPIRPFIDADIDLSFMTGLHPYSGLFDVAVQYGIIVRNNSMYKIPVYSGEKQWYRKDIVTGLESEQIWQMLLPLIDEKSISDLAYGSGDKLSGVYSIEDKPEEDGQIDSGDHMNLGKLIQA